MMGFVDDEIRDTYVHTPTPTHTLTHTHTRRHTRTYVRTLQTRVHTLWKGRLLIESVITMKLLNNRVRDTYMHIHTHAHTYIRMHTSDAGSFIEFAMFRR